MKFRTGASAVEVTALGRVYVTGNSQTHQLILETAAGATLASVNWSPAGGVHNQIKYVALGTPVTLAANTEYYLGSAEVSGGDRWYSYDTVVTTSGAATVLAGAYDIGAGWVNVGVAGNSYVPVSLQYCAEPCVETGLVSSFTPGTLRNNAGGYRGMKFRTGASAVEVTGLGRVYVTGNSQTHQLILETVAGATLASVNWTPAGGVHNQIKYVAWARQ